MLKYTCERKKERNVLLLPLGLVRGKECRLNNSNQQQLLLPKCWFQVRPSISGDCDMIPISQSGANISCIDQ